MHLTRYFIAASVLVWLGACAPPADTDTSGEAEEAAPMMDAAMEATEGMTDAADASMMEAAADAGMEAADADMMGMMEEGAAAGMEAAGADMMEEGGDTMTEADGSDAAMMDDMADEAEAGDMEAADMEMEGAGS